MTTTTAVTLANGRTIEVAGAYEDLKVYLNTGERREVTLATGERMTLATAMVGMVEEITVATRAAFGFARALEA